MNEIGKRARLERGSLAPASDEAQNAGNMPDGEAQGSEGEVRDRKEYFAQWWRDHGQDKRRARRERYANDPDFRKRCQDRVKALREKKKEEGIAPTENEGRQFFVMINGERVPCYTIGKMAVMVGRTQQALNNWQRWGVLPETPMKTEGGIRLYTAEMIEVVREAIESRPGTRKMVRKTDKDFAKQVKQGWRDLGFDWRRKYQHVA